MDTGPKMLRTQDSQKASSRIQGQYHSSGRVKSVERKVETLISKVAELTLLMKMKLSEEEKRKGNVALDGRNEHDCRSRKRMMDCA